MFSFHIALLSLAIVLSSFTLQVSATSAKSAKTILKLHNKLRAKHHSPAVKWDTKLATYAQKWSNKCEFKHSSGSYGENLALGYPSWTTVINGWYNEVKQYNYKNPGVSGQTDHFTAIVWKSTTKIGCGVKTCNNRGKAYKLYTCSYAPFGNIVGNNNQYFVQNVLEP
ncbi:CAP domain-containing protein [Parasitella parasitica]|nr:CAP domain-containing protein [Parasitella parasitica]